MRVTPVQGYAMWADSYASEPNPVLALESRTFKPLLDTLAPKQILDVACGTGRWSSYYRQLGARVIGIDASEQMLAQAAKQHMLSGTLIRADAQALPVSDGVADLVLCSMSLGYFRKLSDVFKEFARTAAANATIAISDLHPAAIAAGWTRSFKNDGQRFDIEHESHSLADIKCAGNSRSSNDSLP